MDFTNEQHEGLIRLACELMRNNEAESAAVIGYNNQLSCIKEVKLLFPEGTEEREYLERLQAATEEKISDELNHSNSLVQEYTVIMGIQPAED